MTSDAWIEAAQALRQTLQDHASVAGLVDQAPYETRGPDRVVRGLALRQEAASVTARAGLHLDAAYVMDRSIEAVVADLRARLIGRWQELAPGQRLFVDLHVVDLAPPGASSTPPRRGVTL